MATLTYTWNAVDGNLNEPPAPADGTFDGFNSFEPAGVTISTTDAADTQFDVGEAVLIDGNPVPYTYQGTDGNGGMYLLNTSNNVVVFWSTSSTVPLVGTSYTINSDPLLCFAAGTLIATPAGERAVETLDVGDFVTSADGRAVPVRWVGRQTLLKVFAGDRACPVRIAKGALGGGLPHSDLVLTSDHALVFDGLAVNAGALVNGSAITREPFATLPERVTYYHIETEAHDVILANGAPAETYVDYVGRRAFDNHAEYIALYGDEPVIGEMPLPRVSSRRQLPADLLARFGIAGFADDVTEEAMAFLASRRAA